MAWEEGSVLDGAGQRWVKDTPSPLMYKKKDGQEGQQEQLSRAQMLTFMSPSCGKWKDSFDILGLRAELSVGTSKSQDQFITFMLSLLSSSLWHRPSTIMEVPPFYQQNPEQR